MNCNNLLLIKIDPITGLYEGDLGSFVVENNENIRKFFFDSKEINLFFDVNKDVEDWEYTAIFDVFPYDKFENQGFMVFDIEDDYNPAWIVKFEYIENHEKLQDRIDKLMNLIEESLEYSFNNIMGKSEEYMNYIEEEKKYE